MGAGILAGLNSAALDLIGSVLTEKFFSRILARLAVAILQKIAKSTATTIDDEAIIPVIEQLKAHY